MSVKEAGWRQGWGMVGPLEHLGISSFDLHPWVHRATPCSLSLVPERKAPSYFPDLLLQDLLTTREI